MIYLKNICLSYGAQKIFDHLSYSIDQEQKLGLVGRNGSGKSTLLKVIAGSIPLDSGVVTTSGTCTIAYMPQELVLNSERSIFDEAFISCKTVGPLWQRSQELEVLLANDKDNTTLLEEYGHILHELALQGLEQARLETKKMLLGLGFKEAHLQDSVQTLSVGWQMRVVLAKLLLQKADFYLFDEPTNHLDIVAKDWFLRFLEDATFGFVLVCHDKYFLDTCCSTILELEQGKGTIYYGNYSDYETQKEENLQALIAAKKQQDKEMERKQELIDKFKAKASKAKWAKGLEKSLEKIEIIELPRSLKEVRFRFQEPKRSGKLVLDVHNLSFSFGPKNIFKNVSFLIERGEKVAIIAPNGVGKTTLFNVLCGKYTPTTGSFTLGMDVEPAVFEQEQTKVLNPNKSVIQEVLDATPNKTEQEIRTFLGAFLFGKDEIQKKTKVLSGGERNRVSMVKVLLQNANFLLLDEPTNHLDIPSKEILLKALQEYKGTMLFVSHDHDFVNHLATSILELTADGIFKFHGNYESFLHQKAHTQQVAPKNSNNQNTASTNHQEQSNGSSASYEQKKNLGALERKIAKLEKEKEKVQESFADLDYGTPEFSNAQQKLDALTKELAELEQEYLQLV